MNENKKEKMNELDDPKMEQVTGGERGIIELRVENPHPICSDFDQLRQGEECCQNCVYYGFHGGLESCEKHQFIF